MLQKCIAATFMLFVAGGIYLAGECRPFVRYWRLAWELYGTGFITVTSILFVDVACILYLVVRWLLLQETGRKLAHLEKQLTTGESVSAELARLVQEKER